MIDPALIEMPKDQYVRAHDAIRTSVAATLIDPASAVFVFETPIRMTCSARLFPANAEDNRWHGWGIPFSVNGRNRFGGYAGAQQFIGFVMVDRVEVFLPRYRNNMHCRPE